ncbi:UNVERIFIED_CONTAM: hypothetical protein Scaly_2042900 [Sesamum calycinum]|uniref:CCHC-type domain-containing protein n=1 Tax=Sesamum calycinum TaxID=2727403 RepID=A0AAW2N3R2_9LAMI
MRIRTSIEEEQLVTFTYERLPNFCYLCGHLGHIVKYCKTRFRGGFQDPGDNTPYGLWLGAQFPTRSRGRSTGVESTSHFPSYSPQLQTPRRRHERLKACLNHHDVGVEGQNFGDSQAFMVKKTWHNTRNRGVCSIGYVAYQYDHGYARAISMKYCISRKSKESVPRAQWWEEPHTVTARLDPACSTVACTTLFPGARVHHESVASSDHKIFKSTAVNGAMISEVINAMETPPVSNNMNVELIRSSTANEAQRALLANILGIQVVAKHLGGDWNENLVHAEFKEDDASCILSIPFPDQPGHDEIVWHYERSRTFSVEQKVHLFAWKVCKNAFPTVCNLKKQEVEVKDGCVLYDAKEETVLHALLLCPFARLVWALSSLHGWSFPNMRAGWKEWMRGVHRELDREDFALFVLISWRLWYSRNKWIFLRRDIAEGRGIEYG